MEKLDIANIQSDLSGKKYSAVQMVDKLLSRIRAFDKELNSFITVTEEYAYERAKKIDKIISDNPRAFEEFSLLGVPFTLKDIYLTEGIRTTAGTRMLSGYIPVYSSSVFRRLEAAGAILIGKTNLDAWAHGASGENSEFGATLNPWDKTRVPGGSSSGSAVSVASQFCSFSMGTDTGGSVRLPASFTNLVGLKPTYGAVSRYGVIAMSSSMDSMGNFTRNVEDADRVHGVVKGKDGFDGTVSLGEYIPPKGSVRIGVPREYFVEGINSEVENAVRQAITKFEEMGQVVKEVSLPHVKYSVATYYIIQSAEVSSNLARYDGVRYGGERDIFGGEAVRRIILGTFVLSSGYSEQYYLKAEKVRSRIRRDFERAFEEVDVLIAPVSPSLPYKLGEKTDSPLSMYLADIFTCGVNLAKLPAIGMPGGFSQEGLPIGFQLIGPKFSEEMLFRLGADYQKETDWHSRSPVL